MAPTVLIVESDEQSASQLARAFDAAGFAVSHSADPEDAWRRIERGKPSMVVLCAELAGTGGYRLCKKIKSSASTSTIPVFLTSSTASAEVFDLHSKRAYRAEAYFRKPVRPEAVAAHAATLVGALEDSGAEVRLDDLVGDLDEVPVASREIDTRNVDAVSELARRRLPQDVSFSASPPAVPTAATAEASEPGAALTLEPVELTPRELALLNDEADDVDGSGEPIDEGQTDVRDMTEMFGRAAEAAATRQLHGEIERLSARIGELEEAHAGTLADLASARERVRAREEELEVLRGSHQSGARMSAATSERELLTVREALSAKEREVLDLRDERHAKEREAIGLRDQVSALTAQVREHTDELGDVRARLGAAEQSRDEALERARSSEAALSTAQNEAELRDRAAVADLAAVTRRLETTTQDLAAAQSSFETSESEAESLRQAVTELRAQLSDAQTLAAQNEARWESENERATAATAAADALTAELADLGATSETALKAAETAAAARIAAAEQAAAEQVDTIKSNAAAELAASTSAAEAQFATLRAELSDANRSSAAQIEQLQQALAAAEQAALTAASEHQGELAGAEAAAAAQLSALRMAQEQASAAAEERRDALQTTLAETERAHAARVQELESAHATLVLDHEKALAALRETLTGEHARELAEERSQREEAALAHSAAMATATEAAEKQLRDLRQSLGAVVAEKASALAALATEHETALAALAREHEEALSNASAASDAALEAAAREHEAAQAASAAEAAAALEAARVSAEEAARSAAEAAAAQARDEREEALRAQAEHHTQQNAALKLALSEELSAERAERAEEAKRTRAAAKAVVDSANAHGAALVAAAAAEEERAGLVIASLLRDVQSVTDSEAVLRERVAAGERAMASLLAAARTAAEALADDPVEPAVRSAGDALIEWQTERQTLEWREISLEEHARAGGLDAEDTAEVDLRDAAEAPGYASSGLPMDADAPIDLRSDDDESLGLAADDDPSLGLPDEEWVEPTEVDGVSLAGASAEGPAPEHADDDSELPFEVSLEDPEAESLAAGTAETQQISDPDMLRAVQAAQSARQVADTTQSLIDPDNRTQGPAPDPAPKRAKQNTTVEVGVNAHANFDEPDFVIQRQPSFDLTDADERVEWSESGVPITYVEASGRGDTAAAVRVGSITSMGAPGDAVAEARARGAAFEREPTRNEVELVDVEDRFVVEQLSDLSALDDAMVDLNEDEIDEDDFV